MLAEFRLSPRQGSGSDAARGPISGFEELGVSWGLRWLLVAGALCREIPQAVPCIALRCRRSVVPSAPLLVGRRGVAPVPSACALWWCAGGVWAMLWCW